MGVPCLRHNNSLTVTLRGEREVQPQTRLALRTYLPHTGERGLSSLASQTFLIVGLFAGHQFDLRRVGGVVCLHPTGKASALDRSSSAGNRAT